MLTVSSIENLIVECSLKANLRYLPLASISIILMLAGIYPSFSAEWYRCTKFLIIR